MPKRFRSSNDYWLLVWVAVCVLLAYVFARQAMREHWSVVRWIVGAAMGAFFVGPLFVLAYIRWFKSDD